MNSTTIFELDSFQTNERNGTYGGKAGGKEAITINGEYWIVKYPQSTKLMRGVTDPYTTSPLSEYIGSNVYRILGLDVHETILGIRNNKLVVACKDFCKREGSLREIRTLKNIYNKDLAEQLEKSFSSTSSSHLVDIDELLTHLDYNPILKTIPNIKERFWEQFIVDILINNNDRNNGNWGVLYENGTYRLAPVFDNGASFSNKTPDFKLSIMLDDESRFCQSADTSRTIYSSSEKEIYAKDIVTLEYEDLYRASKKIVPIIIDKTETIKGFIQDIPESYNGINVCSDIRKEFYIKSLEYKLNHYLIPTYNKALNRMPDQAKEQPAASKDEVLDLTAAQGKGR